MSGDRDRIAKRAKEGEKLVARERKGRREKSRKENKKKLLVK